MRARFILPNDQKFETGASFTLGARRRSKPLVPSECRLAEG
jgi:hypothetical protein